MAGDFSGPLLLVDVTVCGSPSLLVQVTVVPTFTLSDAGLNANPAIVTALPATGALAPPEPLEGAGMLDIVSPDAGAGAAGALAGAGFPHPASTTPTTDSPIQNPIADLMPSKPRSPLGKPGTDSPTNSAGGYRFTHASRTA